MSEYILQMEHIDKSFFGVKVLDDVRFALKKGHVHALVGGNGAGKSTLMKILTGIYKKDAGSIKVNNVEVNFSDYSDANQNGIRMIFQELSVVPTLSVVENIFLNIEKKNGLFLDQKKMLRKAKQLLNQFNIDIPLKEKISNLSVGHCQLVEIAKALIKDAEIIVMDEPTASLSDDEVKLLFEIIKVIKSKGVSIVYISHRMGEILEIADDVTILRDGRYITTEKSTDLTIEKIIEYMLGNSDKRVMKFKERKHKIGEQLLSVKDLCVDNLIDNVSFEIRAGEIVGLAGLMGSGRTEIAEALFGARKIQHGEVFIKGSPVKIKCVKDAIDAGIALIPEDRRRKGLILEHSLKDNMLLSLFDLTKKGLLIDRKKISRYANYGVEELDIKTDSINKSVSLLSGGNQQKIVIAKWLKIEPDILLLDEPTAGIDVGAKGDIMEIIEKLAEQGKGVLFISSEIPEMIALCDRLIILHNGKIVGELMHDDIDKEEVVQHAIQG